MSNNTISYPGDCTTFDRGWILGPDDFGARYEQVSASYDAAANRTTITLRPITAQQWEQFVAADKFNTDRRLDDLQRIYNLFGGAL